jgi:hypothetical protein
MSSPVSIDPLKTVDLLVDEISGANNMPVEISRLIRAIDMLTYSIHFIGSDVPYIEEMAFEAATSEYRQLYENIGHRYTTLGYYWDALNPILQDGTEGELAVGDAIDDLAWMHIHPLRRYLEEVKQNG